jgi:Helix-turn-helix of DDE superfamily endonuclease
LKTLQDRLFFILFYLKVYPLQEVLAHLFGMSQGHANFYIYELSQVLRKTLEKTGDLPARVPEEMLMRLAEEESQDFGIDGTERRIERPKDPVYQKHYYSGKKKAHTLKNNLIAGLDDRQIKHLGKTHEG